MTVKLREIPWPLQLVRLGRQGPTARGLHRAKSSSAEAADDQPARVRYEQRKGKTCHRCIRIQFTYGSSWQHPRVNPGCMSNTKRFPRSVDGSVCLCWRE